MEKEPAPSDFLKLLPYPLNRFGVGNKILFMVLLIFLCYTIGLSLVIGVTSFNNLALVETYVGKLVDQKLPAAIVMTIADQRRHAVAVSDHMNQLPLIKTFKNFQDLIIADLFSSPAVKVVSGRLTYCNTTEFRHRVLAGPFRFGPFAGAG